MFSIALACRTPLREAPTALREDHGVREGWRLDQLIAEPPRFHKEPLLLTMLYGLSQAEAARELRISTKVVEMWIRRARQRLREIMASAGNE